MESPAFGSRKNSRTVIVSEEIDQWINIQTKTFTRWCNSHLKKRDLEIKELFADVSDGTLLLNLLEIIGGDSIKAICGRNFYPKEKVKIELHKLENCNLIIDYLKKKQLKLVNIGSSDIKDGNPRLVLGLLWTIILRFAISEDGKEGLLLWCRKNSANYAGVDIQNFSRSWQDGLAFCSIIHQFRPDLIDYEACIPDTPVNNLNKAFDIGANHLNIDRILDAEDIVGNSKPDEKSIIAYLSLYFQEFAPMGKKDALSHSIVKALAVTRHHEKVIGTYTADSAAMKEWIEANTNKSDLTGAGLTAEVQKLIEEFHEFRNTTKPAQQSKLVAIEGLLTNLRLSQRNNDRPLYAPVIESEALEADWAGMEKNELKYEKSALALLDEFEKTDYTLQRFNNKVEKVEAFSATNTFTAADINTSSTSSHHLMIKKITIFENQCAKYSTVLTSCGEFVDTCAPQHSETAPAKVRYAKACEEFAKVKGDAVTFKVRILVLIEEESKRLALKEKYEISLANYEFQLFEYQEVLMEPVSLCNDVDAVIEVISKTSDVAAKLSDKEEELVALEAMRAELGDCPVEKEVNGVRDLYTEIENSVGERFAKLNFARAAQQSKAEMRAAFAAAANALVDYCQELSRATAVTGRRLSITSSSQGSKLDEKLASYKTVGGALMQDVESCHEAQAGAGIYTNPLTIHTIFACRNIYEQCGEAMEDAIDLNAAHLDAQNAGAAMSADTAKEIREAFDSFDTRRNGSLSLKEFIFGLQGMGVVLSDAQAEIEFRRSDKDTNGVLNFTEFAGYILEHFKSGSTETDIAAAWKGLAAGQDTISVEVMSKHFATDETGALQYLLERMPGSTTSKDYVAYNVEMFKN